MTIYLDNMAATPLDHRVADKQREAMLRLPGNANSTEHEFGIAAQREIERAEGRILSTFGSASETITFTPGASAALWLGVEDAIVRGNGRSVHIAATAVEHPALLASLRRAEAAGRLSLTIVPVDGTGAPRLESIEATLRTGVDLLCTMAANNEVGTITDLEAIGLLAATYGARHFVDASQAAGRIDMRHAVMADMLVVSGAKMYGPRRVGALIGSLHRQASGLAHDVFGSPDASGAIALAFAAELREGERSVDEPRIAAMRETLESYLIANVPDIRVNGARHSRLSGSLHVSTPHLPGDAAVAKLWGKVAVSTGAACQSGVPGPSHVLSAMDIPVWAREGAVRIGIGRFNSEDEVVRAGELISAALNGSTSERRIA